MAELLKNAYNNEFVLKLGRSLKEVDPDFSIDLFEKIIFNTEFKELELLDRMHHITECLHKSLAYTLKKQLNILDQIVDQFSGFTAIIFPHFVELYAIHDVELGLSKLKLYTTYSTSEFAIRPFIIKYPKESLAFLLKCASDDNFHVRRLASEGCRPLLPWSFKLRDFVENPKTILPILELLKNDPEDYVYRSVANNLNDISKNHPELVLSTCNAWLKTPSKNTKWIVKHALRTLLKKGNIEALKAIGIDSSNQLTVNKFELSCDNIKIGDSAQLSFNLKNLKKTALFRLEYVIYYLKNNNKHNTKVFQIKETNLKQNESLNLSKKISFQQLSTRKLYPGKHFISLKINGVEQNKVEFTLT